MSLYTIGDLHLSFGSQKPMNIFGDNWENHEKQIAQNWHLNDKDTIVLCGDTSWAIDFEQAAYDFEFINNLKGKKIILKGNHDYWWSTQNKLKNFAEKYPTITFLHNNSFHVENSNICGTRGWILMPDEKADMKILKREVIRLEFSLKSVENDDEKIVFLHYPPIFYNIRCDEIIEILHKYNVKRCYYGHLHGYAFKHAFIGTDEGISYELISSDYIKFIPKKII